MLEMLFLQNAGNSSRILNKDVAMYSSRNSDEISSAENI